MQNINPITVISMPNRTTLPNPDTPWMMSQEVFQRLQGPNNSYKKCEITSNDREWLFVLSYFTSHPPKNRHIGRVHCIHTPESIKGFEAKILTSEKEAGVSVFDPHWDKEPESMLREKVINRWNGMTSHYSPFIIVGKEKRQDKYDKVKILPLWHGSTAAKCDSICKTGFTSFGKHALVQGGASPGLNTDIGYFGSGIYFTNSARYAALDCYSDGNLLLAWVSMREPYPVVADCEYPNEPKDMKTLKGGPAYENYNAHHIPVISVNPANNNCVIYYPCTANQEPAFDEIVVFNNAQALTRFWVELEVTLPNPLFPSIKTFGKLQNKILELLDHPEVKQNPELTNLLESKSKVLFSISGATPLDQDNLEFYQKITKLMDDAGKVRSFVAKQLIPISKKTVVPQLIADPVPASVSTWKKVAVFVFCIFIVAGAIFGVPFFLPRRDLQASHEVFNEDICVGDQCSVQPISNNPVSPPQPGALHHIPIQSKVEILSTLEKVENKEIKPEEFKSRQGIELPSIAFGASKWNKYFGDIGVEPPLPIDIEAILNSPCPFWPDKKVSDTHLLILIPQMVNGRPWTLDSIDEFIQNPKEGYKTKYDNFEMGVLSEFGNQFSSSYWVLITRDVIPDSRNKVYEDQKKLVATYVQKGGQSYELIKAREVVTCISMECVQKGTKLYDDNSFPCTNCQEKVRNQWPVVIGDYGEAGLFIHDQRYGKKSDNLGIMVSRKLQGILNPLQVEISSYQETTKTKKEAIEKPRGSQGEKYLDMTFGAVKWNKYFGDIGVEPPLPLDIEAILNNPCPFWPNMKVQDTHLLVLVPETVNGKPWTYNSIYEFIQNPKDGFITRYHELSYSSKDIISEVLGGKSTASHWVLMTRYEIPNSFNIGYEDQKNLLTTYSIKTGLSYKLPTVIEAMTCIFMEHVQTGTRLYKNIQISCQDKVSNHPVSIGFFSNSAELGLTIDFASKDFNAIAGSRRF